MLKSKAFPDVHPNYLSVKKTNLFIHARNKILFEAGDFSMMGGFSLLSPTQDFRTIDQPGDFIFGQTEQAELQH